MIFPSKMLKLFAVVLDRDVEGVTRILLEEGVMQFITVSPLTGHTDVKPSNNIPVAMTSGITSARQRIESILIPAGITLDLPEAKDLEDRSEIDIKAVESELDSMERQIQGIRDRQRSLQQEILKLEDLKRQIDLYGLDISQSLLRSDYSFLSIRTGKIPLKNIDKFDNEIRGYPAVAIRSGETDEWINLIVVSTKRDSSAIDSLLQSASWNEVILSREISQINAGAVEDLKSRIDSLHVQQEQEGKSADAAVLKHSDELKNKWVHLRVNELLCTIRSYFSHSVRTTVFSGWLPASKQPSLSKKLLEVTGNRCYLEWLEPKSGSRIKETDNPPVQLNNPKFLSPFQMLVANFGIPEYGTIDPTPAVTVTYLFMFGLMFADAGHGLLLSITGFAGLFIIRKTTQNIRNLLTLLIWCGFSSMIFGVLFGSYFGKGFFKPLWFDFHGLISGHTESLSSIHSIMDVLSITVYFGIGVIGVGLIFNWINLMRKRKWFEMFFDMGGFLGGWIYTGGVYSAGFLVRSGYKHLPPLENLMLLMGIPALLLAFKAPLHFFAGSHSERLKFTLMTPFDFAMEWVVELLEIFSRYLSNTLSFMRVAGLGIAHISLMIATYQLAGTASANGKQNAFSIAIIIIGNIFVIALEGLSAGIQALRLNYYEFFTKFFHGTGKLYSPISLKSQ